MPLGDCRPSWKHMNSRFSKTQSQVRKERTTEDIFLQMHTLYILTFQHHTHTHRWKVVQEDPDSDLGLHVRVHPLTQPPCPNQKSKTTLVSQ